MNMQLHEQLKGHIWDIANRLRGPYRPPQYRLVMLPMVVLRRLDCVLAPTKDEVLQEYERCQATNLPEAAMERMLGKAADPKRKHPLYNTSPFTFRKLLDDSENIAPNLVAYINGFSPTARHIFERFKFGDQIEKLDASNRLYTIVKEMAAVNLHPDTIDNLQMGYLFEHLVMRFNEQANEEAGDHFTPREVIRLMANLVYTGEQDVYTPGIVRTIYDPACGTGGMLSESEKFILGQNESANLLLQGQEYNDESWAICCADILIKDEDTANIVLGDTLGDGKTHDGFQRRRFHFMLANPPFGVEWKDQKTGVENEHKQQGFNGRFGAGLPAINDGSLLFLQHMISKIHPAPDPDGDNGGEGSKIAIVFNGSPLFSGDAGSGPSNIRRWIIENDWLDAIVALPDQLFYNTGIFTYVWLVTNRKAPERAGRVQLIDGTRFFRKMKKSLNNKRNEITEEQIRHLTRVYGNFQDGETAPDGVEFSIDGEAEPRVISRIFDNREFGFLKVTVERPLRMSFEASPNRIARLDDQTAFANLAVSKKRKDKPGRHPHPARDAGRQGSVPGPRQARCRSHQGREAGRHQAPRPDQEGHLRRPRRARAGGRDLPRQEGPPGARQRAARYREHPAAAGHDAAAAHGVRAGQAQRGAGQGVQGHHRRLHAARGPAACARCLGGLREDQGRLRDPHQPPLLRLQAAAAAGGDRGGHHAARRGDRRAAEGLDDPMKDKVLAAASKRILFLPHAIRQISRPERMISTEEIRNAIFHGDIIEEYPQDVRGESCLMLSAPGQRPVHVVCAPRADYLAVITAYLPSPDKWSDDFRVRK